MPKNTFEIGLSTPYCFLQISAMPHSRLKLIPFEIWETLPSFCFRNAPFRFRTWIKKQTMCTTSKANTNDFAQIWSLQVQLPVSRALAPVIVRRPSLTKHLKDSKSWTAVSQAMEQSLGHPAHTLLWSSHNQALDPPLVDKAGIPKEDSDLVAAINKTRESWTCTMEGNVKLLFQKRTPPTKSKWQYYSVFYFACFRQWFPQQIYPAVKYANQSPTQG